MAAALASNFLLTKRGGAQRGPIHLESTAPHESAETRIPDRDTLIQYMGGREAMLTAERMLPPKASQKAIRGDCESCSRLREENNSTSL